MTRLIKNRNEEEKSILETIAVFFFFFFFFGSRNDGLQEVQRKEFMAAPPGTESVRT